MEQMYPDWILLDQRRYLEHVSRRIVLQDGIQLHKPIRVEGRMFKSVADASHHLGIARIDIVRLLNEGKATYL